METDRIFITGATGFLAQQVVAHLLKEKRGLTLAVRDAARCRRTWRDHPDVSILEMGEMGPDTDFTDALSDAAAVVHLAGLAHIVATEARDAEARFMDANAGMTEALVRAVRGSKVRSFVHLSSLAAIIPNAVAGIVDDSTDIGPVTAYGRSKREAERHVRALAEAGIFSISLRPPLIVGSRARGNWAALQALAWSGLPLPFASIRNRRSFVSAQTLCEAISLLCGRAWPTGLSGDYCIADPQTFSLPEIVRLLREGMGKPARLVPFPGSVIAMAGALTGRRQRIQGMIGDLNVDGSRFLDTFGLQPQTTLADAIVRSGAEYAANRSGMAA